MIAFYKKYAKTIFDIGLIVLTVYLTMLLFSIVYNIAKPIFVGLLIFFMIEPLAKFFHKRGMKKSIATALSMLIFIILVLGILVTLGIIFTAEIYQLSQAIPGYVTFLKEQILGQIELLKEKIDTLPEGTLDKINEYSGTIAEKSSRFISNILLSIWGVLTSIPTLIFNFVIGLILAYFLSIEIDTWKRIAEEKTPNTFKKAFHFLKENVLKGIITYLKAQSILVSISFFMILVGLFILNVDNAFSIALLSAVFDLLPILGVSTVFVPWIIYLFIVKQTSLAFWLLLLLLIVIVVRQLLEPKITGESLGVSAFTMLSFMIISLSLFGVAGVILSPILLILIKALYDQGYLRRWIRMPEGEYSDKPVKED